MISTAIGILTEHSMGRIVSNGTWDEFEHLLVKAGWRPDEAREERLALQNEDALNTLDIREHYGTIKCATCVISSGCHNCIRGDDLAEIARLRAALRKAAPVVELAAEWDLTAEIEALIGEEATNGDT